MARIIEIKIGCCGECPYYSMKKHKCQRGAVDEGDPREHFFRDCPLSWRELPENVDTSSEKEAFKVWNKRFADTTLVHAHWKGYHTQEPYCSNCGFTYDHEQGEDAQITDYCGNCGAKMDENEVENLKHCSCGDRHYCPEVEKDENGKWFIRCHMCHKIVRGNTIEEAVNAWNRRADTNDP